MSFFLSTLNQIAFLFGFIVIGYIFMKCRLLPEDSSVVLSKLENMLFIPALVMGTFITNFTIERILSAWKLLLISFAIAFIVIPLAVLVSGLITKDTYIRRIYIYGLSFSNFGFMGNAIVSSLFPDIFFEYLIFTLPLWILIYIWGVPRLLLAGSDKKQSFKLGIERLYVADRYASYGHGCIIHFAKTNFYRYKNISCVCYQACYHTAYIYYSCFFFSYA